MSAIDLVDMKAAAENQGFAKPKKPPAKRLLLPAIVYVAVVTQIPFLITIYLSLQKWNLMRPDQGIAFSGLHNFAAVLSQSYFYKVVWNTTQMTVLSLLICLVLGMVLALLLNRPFIGRGFVRTLIISPFFVMPAVSGIIWKTMFFNPNFGFSAYISRLFGQTPVDWLGQHPLLMIVLMISWQWMPFFMLVLLAGLQSVQHELLEASHLDGATKLQQFHYVIFPHLLRYIEVAMLLGLIFILQAFGEIYVSTSGGPGYASTNLTFLVFRTGFQGWDVGGASAVGVLIVILTLILMTFLFKFLRRVFGGELS